MGRTPERVLAAIVLIEIWTLPLFRLCSLSADKSAGLLTDAIEMRRISIQFMASQHSGTFDPECLSKGARFRKGWLYLEWHGSV